MTNKKAFNFEIYTCNPATGEGGWDIKNPYIFAEDKKAAKEILKNDYPDFDCIILFNHEIELTPEFQALVDKGEKFILDSSGYPHYN